MTALTALLILSTFFYCDVTASIEDSLQDLNIPGLPAGIPTDLSNITNALPIEEAQKVLEDKCRANSGGDEAFASARQASIEATECLKSIVDIAELQEEIEKRKKTGDLDLVFKNYCQKKTTLKECITNLTRAYEPCLDKEEVSTQDTAVNVSNSLIDFICFKDGDRIALFIAEGGPECINGSMPQIKTCVETIFNIKVEGDVPTLDSLPQLVLKTEECDKFTALQECVVKDLEKCRETTPANVVDSLFNFIRKHTPCQAMLRKGAPGASVYHYLSPVAAIISLLLIAAAN